MSITLSTCLSRNLFQHSPSSFRRIYYSVSSGYILSHLLSCPKLLFYLEIVLTNCTVLISEKKLHKIVWIIFHFLSRGATSAVIQGDSGP